MENLSFIFLLLFSDSAPVNPGDIIITEIMQNPSGPDVEREWFEVFNPSAAPINMMNWAINGSTALESHVITSSVLIPPASFVVFGQSDDTLVNGGVNVDYVYSDITLSNNAADVLSIVSPNDVSIDTVSWQNSMDGASRNLNPSNFNSTDNDSDANWCASTSGFGDGDLGTPGTANIDCIP